MPGSVRENDEDVLNFVEQNKIERVLDIGAGKGTYGMMLGGWVDAIDAVEVWEPYVDEYELNEIYDSVNIVDVRTLNTNFYRGYDLVIFGDVLEHMSEEDSKAVWKNASSAKYGLISVPIIHYPQGAEFGNHYEIHVQEHLHPEDIRRDYGPFVLDKVYEITGTFIRKF